MHNYDLTLDALKLVSENSDFYYHLFQSIKAPIHLIGRDFKIRWMNVLPRLSVRHNLKGLVGRRCYEAYFARDTPCRDCPVKIAFDSLTPYGVEKWFTLSDGSRRCFDVRVYLVSDEDEEAAFALKIGFDVTERKKLLSRLMRTPRVGTPKLSLAAGSEWTDPRASDESAVRFDLTARELDVLRLIAAGLTNGEISEALAISRHTVKSHVIHIFNKLGVSDRTEAAVLAARLGMI